MVFEHELAVARRAVRTASEAALRIQLTGFTEESKSDESPVTLADRECERIIMEIIGDAFPEDGFLGEEGASIPSQNGRRWIIDPIDGTRDFVRGNPLWSHMIGLEEDGTCVVGVVLMPILGHLYCAALGLGAWRDDVRIRVSDKQRPSDSVLCPNALNSFAKHPIGPRMLEWAGQFWGVRSLGGGLDAMLVASGKAEVWIEPKLQAWDLAGPKVILEEAGAKVWNFDGKSDIFGGNVCAFAPGLEPAVTEFLGI